jgi:hypothetical protein
MPAQNPPAELPMSLTLGGGPTVGRLRFGAMRITGRDVWGPPPDAFMIIRSSIIIFGMVDLEANSSVTSWSSFGDDYCDLQAEPGS